jgi:hypothetical protein
LRQVLAILSVQLRDGHLPPRWRSGLCRSFVRFFLILAFGAARFSGIQNGWYVRLPSRLLFWFIVLRVAFFFALERRWWAVLGVFTTSTRNQEAESVLFGGCCCCHALKFHTHCLFVVLLLAIDRFDDHFTTQIQPLVDYSSETNSC